MSVRRLPECPARVRHPVSFTHEHYTSRTGGPLRPGRAAWGPLTNGPRPRLSGFLGAGPFPRSGAKLFMIRELPLHPLQLLLPAGPECLSSSGARPALSCGGRGGGWGTACPISIHSTTEAIMMAAKCPSGGDVRKRGGLPKQQRDVRCTVSMATESRPEYFPSWNDGSESQQQCG